MKWKSLALWPIEAGVRSSDDNHDTKEQAHAVCIRLRLEGFGGNRQIFPTQVFVEDPNGNVTLV